MIYKKLSALFISTVMMVIVYAAATVSAQGFDPKLNTQGLDHTTNSSAASRAMGGTSLGMHNDITIMFSNPAALYTLTGPQVSVGNYYQNNNTSQLQQYAPAKYQPLWSLFMEGLTDLVPYHDTSVVDTGSNKMPRPYDKIGPNWTKSSSKNYPLQGMVAVPYEMGDMKFVLGGGVTQYANLNHFYQNNNVMSPFITSQRAYSSPFLYLTGADSLPVQLYQSITSREGKLTGYGGALSFSLDNSLSFGISALYIKGSSDDYAYTLGRSKLVFRANYFRADSVDYSVTTYGTSDYTGQEYTFSGSYSSERFKIGFSVKPQTTITRTYSYTEKRDSAGTSQTNQIHGEEKIIIPVRGMIGISAPIKSYLKLALEYEYRPFDKMKYQQTGSAAESKPWLEASNIHAGLEYTPNKWLAVRLGAREQYEVFQPEGNPIDGEAANTVVYSVGFGISYESFQLNAAYEYALLRYDDTMENTIYQNVKKTYCFSVDLNYTLPKLF